MTYSKVQEGSRFIQTAIEQATDHSLRLRILSELRPALREVITDHYANYVVQKLFDFLRPEDYVDLIPVFADDFVSLSENRVSHFIVQTFIRRIVGKLFPEPSLKTHCHAFFQRVTEKIQTSVASLATTSNGAGVLVAVLQSFPETYVETIVSAVVAKSDAFFSNESGCKVIQTLLPSASESTVTDIVRKIEGKVASCLTESNAASIVKTLLSMKKHRNVICWNIINTCFRGDSFPSSSSSSSSSDGSLIKLLSFRSAFNVFEKLVEVGEDGHLRIMEEFIDRHVDRVKSTPYGTELITLVSQTLDKRSATSHSAQVGLPVSRDREEGAKRHSRDREIGREREYKDNGRDRDRERDKRDRQYKTSSRSDDRSPSRDKERDSGRSTNYSRDRSRDRDKDRDRKDNDRERGRSREREKERERDRDRDRDRVREKDRGKDRDNQRDRDRDRDADRDRDRDRDREKGSRRHRSASPQRGRRRSRSRSPSASPSPYHNRGQKGNQSSMSSQHYRR